MGRRATHACMTCVRRLTERINLLTYCDLCVLVMRHPHVQSCYYLMQSVVCDTHASPSRPYCDHMRLIHKRLRLTCVCRMQPSRALRLPSEVANFKPQNRSRSPQACRAYVARSTKHVEIDAHDLCERSREWLRVSRAARTCSKGLKSISNFAFAAQISLKFFPPIWVVYKHTKNCLFFS